MDRSLDEILAEKKTDSASSRGNHRIRGGRGRRGGDRTENFPRDGIRKSYREEPRNLDKDWVHDKFEDDAPRRSSNRGRRHTPETHIAPQDGKLRVENIHYDLTENDLDELFNRIGPIVKLELQYDRAGRSEGVAFVVYKSLDDAREAIRQFDGANANGQPIRLTMLKSGIGGPRQRNPFDTAVMPGRSLEDRIHRPRARSLSPARDMEDAAKKGIDRYIPRGGSRTRTPPVQHPRRRDGRRPGARRDGGGSGTGSVAEGNGGRGGGRRANGRAAKKTAEELDAEMADYFGGGGGGESKNNDQTAAAPSGNATIDDIDMIE